MRELTIKTKNYYKDKDSIVRIPYSTIVRAEVSKNSKVLLLVTTTMPWFLVVNDKSTRLKHMDHINNIVENKVRESTTIEVDRI